MPPAVTWSHVVTVDGTTFVDMDVQRRQPTCYRVRWTGSAAWSEEVCATPRR